MNYEKFPVLITQLNNTTIHSVLDSGFTNESEVSPVIHSHAFYELIFGVCGEISIDLRDKIAGNINLSIPAGDVCLIPPGLYHSTRAVSEAPIKLALRFSLSQNNGTNDIGEDSSLGTLLRGITTPTVLENAEPIHRIMCKIRDEINGGAPLSQEYVHLLLSQLYILLFRILSNGDCEQKSFSSFLKTDDDNNRQIQIEEYLSSHFTEPLTAEDLAAEMHLSKRQLSRNLKQLFGTSFRQMLIDIRLSRAAQLLADTDMPIDTITDAVGYTSVSGFYTAFRKRYSLTVGEYRRIFGIKNKNY